MKFGKKIVLITVLLSLLFTGNVSETKAATNADQTLSNSTVRTVTGGIFAIPVPHPRIWWTVERLQQARGWWAKHSFIPRTDDAWGNALRYAITKEVQYARAAIGKLMDFYVTDRDLSRGFSDEYRTSDWVPVVYDWCYDQMTPGERQEFLDRYNLYVDTFRRARNGAAEIPGSNYFWGYFRNELNWAIATYHENTMAEIFLSTAMVTRWQQGIIPFYAEDNRGGAPSESPGQYGRYHLGYQLVPLTTVGLLGRDMLGESHWFKEAVYNLIYLTSPASIAEAGHGLFTYGDDEKSENNGIAWAGHEYYGNFMTMAAQRWPNVPVGQHARAWMERIGADKSKYVAAVDSGGQARSLEELPLDYYAPGPSYLSSRNSWNSDASAIFLQLGNTYWTGHRHFDAGTFQIYRAGAQLSPEHVGYSNVFEDGTRAEHTAAHNGITYNGAGQAAAYERGRPKVLRLYSGTDYAYAAVDLSDAYRSEDERFDNPYAGRTIREFIFIKPMETLFVLDRLESTEASVTKAFLLHSSTEPQIVDSDRATIVNNGQLLRITTLTPKHSFRIVDERDRFRPFWRLEDATSGEVVSFLMHALQASSADGEAVAVRIAEEDDKSWSIEFLSKSKGRALLVLNKGLNVLGGLFGYSASGDPQLNPIADIVQGIQVTDNGPVWDSVKPPDKISCIDELTLEGDQTITGHTEWCARKLTVKGNVEVRRDGFLEIGKRGPRLNCEINGNITIESGGVLELGYKPKSGQADLKCLVRGNVNIAGRVTVDNASLLLAGDMPAAVTFEIHGGTLSTRNGAVLGGSVVNGEAFLTLLTFAPGRWDAKDTTVQYIAGILLQEGGVLRGDRLLSGDIADAVHVYHGADVELKNSDYEILFTLDFSRISRPTDALLTLPAPEERFTSWAWNSSRSEAAVGRIVLQNHRVTGWWLNAIVASRGSKPESSITLRDTPIVSIHLEGENLRNEGDALDFRLPVTWTSPVDRTYDPWSADIGDAIPWRGKVPVGHEWRTGNVRWKIEGQPTDIGSWGVYPHGSQTDLILRGPTKIAELLQWDGGTVTLLGNPGKYDAMAWGVYYEAGERTGDSKRITNLILENVHLGGFSPESRGFISQFTAGSGARYQLRDVRIGVAILRALPGGSIVGSDVCTLQIQPPPPPDSPDLRLLEQGGMIRLGEVRQCRTPDLREPPRVLQHPSSQTVKVGETARFSVTSSGSLPLSYQWHKNGRSIPGANASNYATRPTTMADDGALFHCMVRNEFGQAGSHTANLTVIPEITDSVDEGEKTLDMDLGTFRLKLEVPAQAFTRQSTIRVRRPLRLPDSMGNVKTKPTGIGVEILVPEQPRKQVKMIFSNLSGISSSEHLPLLIARFDENLNAWVPLTSNHEPARNQVGALTNQLSLFQVMQMTVSGTVDTAKVFPNPFRPTQGHTAITFANIPPSTKIKIHTLLGEKIKELAANSLGTAVWDGNNDTGSHAVSGIYFALLENNGETKILKVAIQR